LIASIVAGPSELRWSRTVGIAFNKREQKQLEKLHMARVRGAASGILRVSLVVCAVLGAASFQTATSFYPKLRCTAMLHVKTAKIGHTARGTVGAARSGSRAATARRLAMSSSPSETGAMTISYKTINIKTGPGSPQGNPFMPAGPLMMWT
jgi:hypothetical protein